MNIEDLKQNIEKQVGVPAFLLTGETAEENIAQAKALLAYKREADAQRPRTAKEQFAEWISAQAGTKEPDTAGAALAQIEEKARVEAGGYPSLKDGGSVNVRTNDPRSTKEQFAEWVNSVSAFDPLKTSWKHL